ncbi:Cleavage and polyadenylation specificity factor subunit 4 [Coemansia interrupta]|uniref:mRNA 3'-end-processing protein n=1 Tax=Coemansia interrupta TaxID=1126814 RepID=A0A9W8LIH9_9FUNG|nr:Cleavage and polyadenylation specificity factor subunit 4 [Coemansia interrupta]
MNTTATTTAVAATPSKDARPVFGALDTQAASATLRFDFEDFITKELRLNLTHTPQTQKQSSQRSIQNEGKIGVCNYFLKGHCYKGTACIYRHLTREESERFQSSSRTVVCKHWIRGLCKMGDMCEFLHEYNLKKMPECHFFSENGMCTNGEECFYQHINPESRVKECPWYARGFCKHGAGCRSRHVRRVICPNYRFGFCPKGPACNDEHPRFDLPVATAANNIIGMPNPAGAVPGFSPGAMPMNPQMMQQQMMNQQQQQHQQQS